MCRGVGSIVEIPEVLFELSVLKGVGSLFHVCMAVAELF